MEIEVSELSPAHLAEYAAVPIGFRVTHRVTRRACVCAEQEPLPVEPVPIPYDKDYDALPGMAPHAWPRRFELRAWGLLVARSEGVVIGGAAIAPAAETIDGVESPEDSAVLWDLRVAPARRGQGAGTALFHAAERLATGRGYAWLVVETQDVNVGACAFYRRMGCRLASYEENGYPDVSNEARLVWRRSLESM